MSSLNHLRAISSVNATTVAIVIDRWRVDDGECQSVVNPHREPLLPATAIDACSRQCFHGWEYFHILKEIWDKWVWFSTWFSDKNSGIFGNSNPNRFQQVCVFVQGYPNFLLVEALSLALGQLGHRDVTVFIGAPHILDRCGYRSIRATVSGYPSFFLWNGLQVFSRGKGKEGKLGQTL